MAINYKTGEITIPAKESLSYISGRGWILCVFNLSFLLWLNSMPSGYNANII